MIFGVPMMKSGVTAYSANGRSSIYSGQNLDNKLIINLKTGIFDRVIASFKK